MKKICMVTTSNMNYDSRILNEANSLGDVFDVKVIAKKYPESAVKNPKNFKLELVNYHRFPFFNLNILSSFWSLAKSAFKENPDVYHAHDLDGLLCAYLPAIIKRKALIYDSHELWSDIFPFSNLKGVRWLLGPLERMLIKRVTIGITVNHTISRYLSKRYHKKFYEIYNRPRLDNQKKSKLNIKKRFPGKKIILQLGIVDEGRGLEEIFKTADLLDNSFVFVLLGKGKLEQKIKREIYQNNLQEKIILLPMVKPEEITSAISGVHLGIALTQKISLSYYYSSPNKLTQYVVSGVPVLGSNFPEYKKIILSEAIGEVVDPSNPELIAKKIKSMVGNQSQKKFRKNLTHLKHDYSWKAESIKLKKVYSKIFSENITISRKFKIDVIANFASLFFLGLCGILMNVLIARFYGTATLGTFNEVFAVYIITSQFAAFSVHLSLQKYIAENNFSREIKPIVLSGLIISLFFGLIIGLVIYFSRNFLGAIFHNYAVTRGIVLITPGLIAFSLNKSLLAVMNGFRQMKTYAFFQTFRYFIIVSVILAIILKKISALYLPSSFSIAEIILLPTLLIYNRSSWGLSFSGCNKWLRKHLFFGSRALLGNVLVDLNTRVDILILGIFTNPETVGIYSFAAMIVEGFSQVLSSIKINVNPVMAQLYKRKINLLRKFVEKGIRLSYLYFVSLAIISIFIYPLIYKLFLPKDNLVISWAVFAILLGCLALASGYQPFLMVLVQAGRPKSFSFLIFSIFLINMVLNFLLVPFLGIFGSAIATGISYIASAIILKFLTKSTLGIKI